MGSCSPYLRIAFPNEADVFMEYLDMESLSEEELSQWRETLLRFVRTLTLQQGKRLVLKSPTHTGRIEVLSKMFPGARFIHLTRNPAALFPSTVRLWQSLDAIQGLQLAKGKHLREYVFESLRRMYHGFESQRSQIDPSHILDIRYEDLAADPLGQLEGVYDQLKIGDFETVRPQIEKYVERKRDYRPNRHGLDAETKAEIADKWGDYIRRYGYEQEFDM